jgi:hypothetical protein
MIIHPFLMYCLICWWFFFTLLVQALVSDRERAEKAVYVLLFILAPIAMPVVLVLCVKKLFQ